MFHQKRQHMVRLLQDHPRVDGRASCLIRTRWPMSQLPARRPILKGIIRLTTGTTNTGIVLRLLLRRRLYRIMITPSLAPARTIIKAGLNLIHPRIRHHTYIMQYNHLIARINPCTRIPPNRKLYPLSRPNLPSSVSLHKNPDSISVGYRSCVNPVFSMGNGYKVDMNYL